VKLIVQTCEDDRRRNHRSGLGWHDVESVNDPHPMHLVPHLQGRDSTSRTVGRRKPMKHRLDVIPARSAHVRAVSIGRCSSHGWIRRRRLLLAAATLNVMATSLLPGRAGAQAASQGARKAIFATNAEAEAAAGQFHCQGAHRMGDQWMPCASHGEAGGGHGGGTAAPTGSSTP
jgi:hypothetical protein